MIDEERVPLSLHEEPLKGESSVSAAEYQCALEELERFIKVDTTAITTLDQLLSDVFLVDRSLRSVLVVKGEDKTIYVDFQKRFKTVHKIDKAISGTERVYLSSDRLGTSIIQSDNKEETNNYYVLIPSSTNFALRVNPQSHILGIFAMDWREGKSASYFPTREGADFLELQGYAKILQEAVRDVVSVLPKPSKTPTWLVVDED